MFFVFKGLFWIFCRLKVESSLLAVRFMSVGISAGQSPPTAPLGPNLLEQDELVFWAVGGGMTLTFPPPIASCQLPL